MFLGVKPAGAAYLVYLGVQAFRHRKEMRVADMEAPAGKWRGDLRTILDGIFVGVTNPKGVVVFAAVLPQCVNHSTGHVPLQVMVLGLLPVAIGLVSDTLWGLGASAARSWFARSDRRLWMVGGAGGFAMIGLGVTVATTGRADQSDGKIRDGAWVTELDGDGLKGRPGGMRLTVREKRRIQALSCRSPTPTGCA